MSLEDVTEGDELRFRYHLNEIPGETSRFGRAVEVTPHHVLVKVVEFRDAWYKLRKNPGDDERQVSKHFSEGGEVVGKFGPIIDAVVA